MASRKPDRPHTETNAPHASAVDEGQRRGVSSPTAVAIEALRVGVVPMRVFRRREQIPHEEDLMRVGDPDDDGMNNEYVGEETPGGTSPTPDQSLVDDIGRVYGLQEEDSSGELRAAGDVLQRRDRHRSELRAPRRPTE